MSDIHELKDCKESADFNKSLQDTSLQYDELNYGELEQSIDVPAFEFSSPISSISSNCSSPDRTAVQQHHCGYNNVDDYDDVFEMDTNEFVSLEELKSQISPPSDDECSTLTLTRKSTLETIFEDTYLETPPSTPSNGFSSLSSSASNARRKRRLVRTDLSKTCDEFKENVQKN